MTLNRLLLACALVGLGSPVIGDGPLNSNLPRPSIPGIYIWGKAETLSHQLGKAYVNHYKTDCNGNMLYELDVYLNHHLGGKGIAEIEIVRKRDYDELVVRLRPNAVQKGYRSRWLFGDFEPIWQKEIK
jgi:hypothetical protein